MMLFATLAILQSSQANLSGDVSVFVGNAPVSLPYIGKTRTSVDGSFGWSYETGNENIIPTQLVVQRLNNVRLEGIVKVVYGRSIFFPAGSKVEKNLEGLIQKHSQQLAKYVSEFPENPPRYLAVTAAENNSGNWNVTLTFPETYYGGSQGKVSISQVANTISDALGKQVTISPIFGNPSDKYADIQGFLFTRVQMNSSVDVKENSSLKVFDHSYLIKEFRTIDSEEAKLLEGAVYFSPRSVVVIEKKRESPSVSLAFNFAPFEKSHSVPNVKDSGETEEIKVDKNVSTSFYPPEFRRIAAFSSPTRDFYVSNLKAGTSVQVIGNLVTRGTATLKNIQLPK